MLVVSPLLVLLVLLIGAMRRRRKPVLIGSVLVVVAGIRLRRVGRSRSRGSRGRSSCCCCYCHGRLEPDGRGRHERRGGVLWGRRARAAVSVVVSEFVIIVGFAFFVLFVIVALVFTDLLGRLFDVSFAVDERRQPCAVRSERGALSRPLPERRRADRGGLDRRRRRRGRRRRWGLHPPGSPYRWRREGRRRRPPPAMGSIVLNITAHALGGREQHELAEVGHAPFLERGEASAQPSPFRLDDL